MSRLQAKYKQGDKKYDTLADEIEKEVRKALKSTVWLSEQEAGSQRFLAEHPYVAWIEQLSKAAQFEPSKAEGKTKAKREALLAKFPWIPRLELDLGLDHGSDRPVPPNEKGFIAMGAVPEPVCGFPELLTNQYLYGLQEIVGWRAGVKAGKKLSFEGRDPKKPPAMETTLPGWERIRVFLHGTLPEVPLFAMPWLTHTIHARLAERRKSPSGEPARMDEELAFLDSRWNGFTFQVPFSKDRLVVVQPVHALMTDRNGFFYRFPESAHMAEVGDLPFVSIQAYQQYAQAFFGKRLEFSDFTQNAPAGKPISESFQVDCTYLARYKLLIDELVRAVLCPTLPYPEYMAFADYPKGKMPSERKADGGFDVPRKHVLLIWAFVGKDPVRFADFLYDKLLGKEANRFPNNVNLAAQLTQVVRAEEKEMMLPIVSRILEERNHLSAAGHGQSSPGDFEREFSPYATYLDTNGLPASEFLLESFHAFHERATKVVQDTAYAVVQREIGK